MERDIRSHPDRNLTPDDFDPERQLDNEGELDLTPSVPDIPLGTWPNVAPLDEPELVIPGIGGLVADGTGDVELDSPVTATEGEEQALLERVRRNEAAGATSVEAPAESVPEASTATALTDDTGHTAHGLRVQAGMVVLGADGEKVGTVKAIRVSDFLVNRPLARDIYVPFDFIEGMSDEGVTLKVAHNEVDHQGWAHP